jgi:hypothetical protein
MLPDQELLNAPANAAPGASERVLQNATGCDTFPPLIPLQEAQLHDLPALTTQTQPAPSEPPVASALTKVTATPCTDLSPQQQTALWLLLAGKPDSAVAASLNIHRATILRWRLHTPAFAAELQRRRQEIYQAAADRLRTLVIKSLMILEKALNDRYQETRIQTATHILRLINTRKLADPISLLQDLQDPEGAITTAPPRTDYSAP